MSNFYDIMASYAQRASRATGVPVSVIMAQWDIESAGGTSNAAKSYNNFAGIMYTKNADYQAGKSAQGTYFSGYRTIDSFVNDYIRVMNLGYYADVRNASGIADTVKALALSPYDAGHYGGDGKYILSRIKSKNLTKYDIEGAVPVSSLNLNLNVEDVSKMDNDKLLQYAAIGAGVLALIAISK